MNRPATLRLRALALLAAALLPLGGCAWTNRDNRPVWNAFEEELVPEGDTAFYLTLPLTIPGGLLAILLDTFIVHPAQVVDDATGDTSELWKDVGPQMEEHYYTQLASLPFRVIGTPIAFVIAFLGRSAFDIPPYTSSPGDDGHDHDARSTRHEAELSRGLRLWLRLVAQGSPKGYDGSPPEVWGERLREQLAKARQNASARGLVAIYVYATRNDVPAELIDPLDGLRHADPVVRFLLLEAWRVPADELPDDLRAALREDPSHAVRAIAELRGY